MIGLELTIFCTIPREATHDGKLDLKWEGDPGRGGAGRGAQLAEIWLIKKQ